MDALEGVREHITRMTMEGDIDRELGDGDLRTRLRGFREEARSDAAVSELEQMKREMDSNQLPSGSERVCLVR